MMQQERIRPNPGYRRRQEQERIRPRADYKPPTLHTRLLPAGSMVQSVDVEWCPVCLGRRISEKRVGGRPVWHCDDCENEW